MKKNVLCNNLIPGAAIDAMLDEEPKGEEKRNEMNSCQLGLVDHSAVRALRANCGQKLERIEAKRFGHCVLLLLRQVLIHPRLASNFKCS